ncbi:MAG: rhomboid family intramembrane serine protease [Candidatus Aenigmarchaeota archaeon]|nr:rhomboid family intramembrane serine protease [Candidatus Aenigmarchaeota archaeon]
MRKSYTFWLVGICVIVFILQMIFPSITNEFALYRSRVLGEPWLLITSIFLHGGIEHLFFNMFALTLFGFILENIIGSKKFLFVFFFSGTIASIASAMFYSASLGASGAIFGIMGTLAVLRPRMYVWVMGVPMPMYAAAILWAVIDLVGMFEPTGIANAAHLAGLGSGIVAGIILRKKYGEKTRKEKLTEEEEEAIEHYFDIVDHENFKLQESL